MSAGEPRYVVGAHETFPFRTGWLKKGYDAVRQDGFAFGRDDAVVRLGVGKNMVRSIRFWCLATQIVEAAHSSGSKSLHTTQIGDKLLADDGWDPYLEDPASLWLIHWLLVTNPLRASAWWYIFAVYPDDEFTKPRIVDFLHAVVERQQQTISAVSIARDVDCFLRTYTPSVHLAGSLPEATFDCPLAELELIRPANMEGVYRFRNGWKEGLPPQVVGYALLQFFRAYALHRRSLNLRECLYTPGSPGQVFRLDEDSLLANLNKLTSITGGLIEVTETAGIAQVFLHVDRPDALEDIATGLLDDYYRGCGDGG